MGVEDRLRLIWPEDITEDFVNVIKTTRKISKRGSKPQGQVEVSVQSKWLLGHVALTWDQSHCLIPSKLYRKPSHISLKMQ
jgi:hypothetical protein